MLEPAYQVDVVIVGAGIAGLSAAHRLTSAGITTAVLEAAPYVGGRMSTEKVDGFRLDRAGQLLSTSYPELRLTPGLAELAVRRFAPGVLLHRDGRLQRAGAPALGGSARGARGALHAVRALAGTPRGTAHRGTALGGTVARATAARATTGRGTTVTP
ncbi:NAD(P)-binding protein, partial [Streptomyces rubradiris]